MDGDRSEPALDCTIVDVFAEQPFSGNQLAVFRECGDLDTATMQAIAREMNFSETTFVTEERDGESSVRIFTTDRELPFAGHPTLGTAWVLGRERDSYTLDLPAGRVQVTFAAGGIVWMDPPDVEFGDELSPATAAALLGLAEYEIESDFPSRFATVGPSFVLIGVRTLDALRRIKVDREIYEAVTEGGHLYPFVFSKEVYNPDADFAARMIMVRESGEDAATGSANTAFAALLRTRGQTGDFVVEQGFEIDRPSRLYLKVGDTIRVGGKVRPVLTGTLRLDVAP